MIMLQIKIALPLLFLSNLDAFISLPCLIVVAKLSIIQLNKSDINGHPCLVSNLKEKALTF